MKINHLFRRSMLILALLVMCGGAFAQGTNEKKKREKNPNDGSFWLDLKAGIGITTSFDKSTVPFAYNGLLTHVQPGFTYEWKRCHIRFGAGLDRTRYSSLGGNAYNISGNFEFLYSCLKPSANRWHFWSGASLNGNFDLKQLPSLQNASTNLSIFGNLAAEELVQCDFAYEKGNPAHPWMTAYFQFSLPLFAVVSRPGFAYVMDIPAEEGALQRLVGPNESLFKMFPGCATDLGFTVNLRNGNRFSFGHRWDYLTTGKKGAYRYDNTFRTYYLKFMFKI